MKLSFLGAAGEVTGSSYLVETGSCRFLVDCGMFQGDRDADRKNLAALNFDVRTLDFVLLTHAHLDHSGLLPRLINFGYRGPVYTSTATAALLPTMLKDSAHIHEKEAIWETARRRARRGRDALPVRDAAPLYTVAQAEACATHLYGLDYDTPFTAHADVEIRLRDAGHILGSAIIEVWVKHAGTKKKIVFSGDLGQPARPVLRDPTLIDEADVLLVESTYGNRDHRPLKATIDELVEAIQTTFDGRTSGNVIVPAFALGRTQDLLVLLADLAQSGRLPNLQVFVDSPLATAATQLTLQHAHLLDGQSRRLFGAALKGELPLQIRFTESVEDSKALNSIRSGAVIIAASGMCNAGRIKHHLMQNLSRPECTILFTGYQAHGTLGRKIVDGMRNVRIFQEDVAVRARVYTLGGLSAHADRTALLHWLGGFKRPPQQCFIVHSEQEIATTFADTVREQLDWNVIIPTQGTVAEIG
ncbi:MAG TPA: MBL fold metallo-hydrolase [Burkholderiales bacterium]